MIRSLKVAVFLALAITVVASALPALATNWVDGDWSGEWRGNNKAGTMLGSFKQLRTDVTGDLSLYKTAKGNINTTVEGTVTEEGDFRVTLKGEGVTVKLTGILSGNKIQGKYSSHQLGQGEFTLDRY